jgi:hypothetical protein
VAESKVRSDCSGKFGKEKLAKFFERFSILKKMKVGHTNDWSDFSIHLAIKVTRSQ